MHDIVIANPSAKRIEIPKIGIAHNISHVNDNPTHTRITINTIRVGRNLKIAITTAEI